MQWMRRYSQRIIVPWIGALLITLAVVCVMQWLLGSRTQDLVQQPSAVVVWTSPPPAAVSSAATSSVNEPPPIATEPQSLPLFIEALPVLDAPPINAPLVSQQSQSVPTAKVEVSQNALFQPPTKRPGLSDYSDYLPIAKVEPIYPRSALRRQLEGHVVIEFTVESSGRVTNPTVVESVPRGVFDQSALRALAEFRYRPQVIDGRAISVAGVRHRFTFVINKRSR